MSRFYGSVPWCHTAVLYEVNTRQYTPEGTFKAFGKHLLRLKSMGVTTLWFMPITPIAQKNKKGAMGSPYACKDYMAINPELGTIEDFKQLVARAHQLGIYVIIDWVANHTGWDHIWTTSAPDFYKWDFETNNFKIASGMEDIIELDYENPVMRLLMINAMRFWIDEINIDGFRCDLATWVPVDFWQQARAALEPIKKLFWLGEYDELESYEYGTVFDASYSWKWMHQSEDYCKGKIPFAQLKKLLFDYASLSDATQRIWFTSNHDENSWNGTEYEKYGLNALSMAVFSATWNGIPLIYSGQEVANENRLAFFDKDDIVWNSNDDMAIFYTKLINCKSKNNALRSGDQYVSTFFMNESNSIPVLAYIRICGMDEVLVLINLSDKEEQIVVDNGGRVEVPYKNIFTEAIDFPLQKSELILPPHSYYVGEKISA